MLAGLRSVVIVALIACLSSSISAKEENNDVGSPSLLEDMLALSQGSEIYSREPIVEFQGASINADAAFTTSVDGVSGFTYLEGRVFASTRDFYFRGDEALLSHDENTAYLRVDWFRMIDSSDIPIRDEFFPPTPDVPVSPSRAGDNPKSKSPPEQRKMAVFTCQNGEIYIDGVSTGRNTYSRCQGNNEVTMTCVGNEMIVEINYGVLRCIASVIGGT